MIVTTDVVTVAWCIPPVARLVALTVAGPGTILRLLVIYATALLPNALVAPL